MTIGFISAAEIRYINGCKVEGDYKDGKKNAIWTYYNACGEKVRQETFRDGVLHGKNCRWDDDGFLLSETNWQAGKRHGKWVEYWITGFVRSEGTFNEGCGKLTGYFPSGKKQFEEEYKNNEKIGKQVYWSENGQNRHEHMINEAGQYDGSYKSYPYELEYKNGVILKIVETVSNDGKTSEKIWEPIFNTQAIYN
jgi:antitoxin component YwqK of YwqJK toxin-antitoxin module